MFKQCLTAVALIALSAVAALPQNADYMRRRAALKGTITKEISDYFAQFDKTCFGKAVKIGDPAIYRDAIERNINQIKVGALGEESIRTMSKTAMSLHHTYALIGVNADLLFAFNPAYLPAGGAGYANRQRLVHEMTHHIEFLRGVKSSSKTVTGSNNPYSERNADYQDRIVDKLKLLAKLEALPPNKMGQRIVMWQKFEKDVAELEKGSAAGMTLHDENLEEMTGFKVDAQAIKYHYLGRKCDESLLGMVLVSDMMPGFSASLETVDRGAAGDGSGEIFEAAAVTTDRAEITLPPKLEAEFVWILPDGRKIKGNPATIPNLKGDKAVTVRLVFSAQNVEYELADSLVTAKEAVAVKGGKGYAGSYSGSLQGDLNSRFEFTISLAAEQRWANPEHTVLGKLFAQGKEYEIYGPPQSIGAGVFSATLYDKTFTGDYRAFPIGSFTGMIKGNKFQGEFVLATFEKKFSGTWQVEP